MFLPWRIQRPPRPPRSAGTVAVGPLASPGANRRAAAAVADRAAATGSGDDDMAAFFTASLANRTNCLAASNSRSSWLRPSSSRPSALPAIDARLPPIAVPSGPPTKVPSAPPAIGNTVLTTPFSAPPMALPMGERTTLRTARPTLRISSPRNWSSSCSSRTSSSSSAGPSPTSPPSTRRRGNSSSERRSRRRRDWSPASRTA